jgi:hypothetical protein
MNRRHAAALALGMVLMSCSQQPPWRAEYLTKAKDTAPEDEVISTLGPPSLTRKLENGGEVWVYKFSGASYSAYGYAAAGGTHCTSYVLTFDSAKVLRKWVRDEACSDDPTSGS